AGPHRRRLRRRTDGRRRDRRRPGRGPREPRGGAQGALPAELAAYPGLLPRQPVLRRNPMLVKRRDTAAARSLVRSAINDAPREMLDRRGFLRRSGVVAGGLAAVSAALSVSAVRKAEAGELLQNVPVVLRKNICTHCSVGCTVIAEVQNGVWTGQEPA